MKVHGTPPRGEHDVLRSSLHEGRFGRMFRRLPPAPAYPPEDLASLAESMREQVPAGWNAEPRVEDGDNPVIPAGYTYFGQFVDHDITFDPASSLQRQNDPAALTDFRSPRFDLDSLYGSGPPDEPFQYGRTIDPASSPARLLLGTNGSDEPDLPRNSEGLALIGDPRNDENVIVSQLHLAFARTHNGLAAQVVADSRVGEDQRFEETQRRLRWHYQWIIAYDYLPKICGKQLIDSMLTTRDDGSIDIKRPHYRPENKPYIPVEFSVAAFRFGHSQVRPTYDLNVNVTARPIFSPGDDVGQFDDLRGFRPLPAGWTVDWRLFLPLDYTHPVQPSRLINSKLSDALFDLPNVPADDVQSQSLPLRNLLRGQALGLPSGQDVAKLLKAPRVYTGAELNAVEPTPLWFYLLKEAELDADNQGVSLGWTGARIVAEVLLGLIDADKKSWVNVDPAWKPTLPFTGETFTLSDLVSFATT